MLTWPTCWQDPCGGTVEQTTKVTAGTALSFMQTLMLTWLMCWQDPCGGAVEQTTTVTAGTALSFMQAHSCWHDQHVDMTNVEVQLNRPLRSLHVQHADLYADTILLTWPLWWHDQCGDAVQQTSKVTAYTAYRSLCRYSPFWHDQCRDTADEHYYGN